MGVTKHDASFCASHRLLLLLFPSKTQNPLSSEKVARDVAIKGAVMEKDRSSVLVASNVLDLVNTRRCHTHSGDTGAFDFFPFFSVNVKELQFREQAN